MSQSKDWFFKIIRIAGASFPLASSLVQLQAELDSDALKNRLHKLEDPITHLHPDVVELSRTLYQKLKLTDLEQLHFSEDFYAQYSRPLASLETAGLISKNHVLFSKVPTGINLTDPSFIMYMCNLAEDQQKMQEIVDIVEKCEMGSRLDGDALQTRLDLPRVVIRAVFMIYEAKGYGRVSKITGSCNYQSIVSPEF